MRSQAVRQRVLGVGEAIWQEHEQQRPEWREEVRLEILRLLIALRRDWQPPLRLPQLPQNRGNKLQQVLPALSIIYTDPSQRLSLARAAEAFGLSSNYFNLLFQEAMGTSFAKFCLRLRVNQACHLLSATDRGVEAIAQQTGFSDASHLHHTFVKHCGCTPAHYRRKFRDSSGEDCAPSR